MKRKVVIGLWVVALAVLAGAGYMYASAKAMARQVDDSGGITQAAASIGDLTVSTSGVGELVSVSDVDLGFKQSGVLAELNVVPGDEVEAGEILARLRVTRSEAELAVGLARANLDVILARQALDELHADAGKTTAQALLALEQAEGALAETQDNSLELAQAQQAVASAGQSVEEAEMQLAILNARPSAQAKQVAASSLLFKQKELAALDELVLRLENQIKSASDQNMKDRLRQQLARLKINYIELQAEVEKRQADYDSMDAPVDASELALAQATLVTAQAQLAQAQRELELAEAGPTAGLLAQAQAELSQAQAAWERTKDGPDAQEISAAEAVLSTALARQAVAEQDQLLVELAAPIDGVVISVGASAGDRIAAGDFITLADMSQPMLEISLDESDYNAVQVGYQVNVVFDAYPDTSLSGEVVQVYPSLVAESAQTNLPGMPPELVIIQDLAGSTRALVHLERWPPTPGSLVPLGLTASVDVISAQASDVLLVPVVALHELDSGGYAVYVVRGDELELQPVTVGLQDYTSAQILDGLEAGEAVSLDDAPEMEGAQ